MKYLPAQLMYLARDKRARRNIRSLVRFMVFLFLCILGYSIVFHEIMEMEGRDYSFITGFYWTLTVMSTLGFGDITFHSDIGRLFSLLVLASGVVFLLIMLPFTFIQFFYAPFLEAQSSSRVPKSIPSRVSGHIIIMGAERIALSLAERLSRFNYRYVILIPEVHHALELMDQGYDVVQGEYDDPETYRRLRADKAAMAVALSDDMKNTNAIFTIREVAPHIPVVANAEMADSIDILQLAGATHVYQFMTMLGETLAQRTLSTGERHNLVGNFDGLLVAQAPAAGSPLAGSTIRDCGIRENTGLTIVGLMERGQTQAPLPDRVIDEDDILLLAGSKQQLVAYERFIGSMQQASAPVLIIGGGRVGMAAARELAERGIDYRIVEKKPRIVDPNIVRGDASDFNVLVEAGIKETPAALVTTHTDDLNIYLTIYCRRLRPDIQIISRATMDRNITILHKAGADLVMSYATLAATTVVNLLHPDKVFMLTEGLDIFKLPVPERLQGKTLIQSGIREETGCNVIAVVSDSLLDITPDPKRPLRAGETLILIGSTGAQKQFLEKYQA